VTYRVYRNGGLLAEVGVTHATDPDPGAAGGALYAVTAVYDGASESPPSHAATLPPGVLCMPAGVIVDDAWPFLFPVVWEECIPTNWLPCPIVYVHGHASPPYAEPEPHPECIGLGR
jgi:hypothetical protein